MTATVYISIGNSDDKLTQSAWAQFAADVRAVIRRHAFAVHGEWYSLGDSPWQNACWCIEPPSDDASVEHLKMRLAEQARIWSQDSIAWAPASETEFL